MPRRRPNDDDLRKGFNPEDTGTGPHPTPPDALLASIRAAYDEARRLETRRYVTDTIAERNSA